MASFCKNDSTYGGPFGPDGPLYFQPTYSWREAAEAFARERVAASILGTDASDLIYQLDASRTYNPWPRLEAITAPTTSVNSANDFINPSNLDYLTRSFQHKASTTADELAAAVVRNRCCLLGGVELRWFRAP